MLSSNIIGLVVLTLGGTLIGLLGSFARRPPSAWHLILSTVILATAGVGAAAGNLQHTWIAPTFVVIPFTLALTLQTNLAAAVFNRLHNTRLPWLILAVACPLAASIWAACSEAPKVPEYPSAALVSARRPVVLRKLDGVALLTDAGRMIPLYRAAEPLDRDELDDAEHVVTDHRSLSVIRTDRNGLDYNCHGWVFARGRFWIMGEDVETILEDNGFEPISAPLAGDVIIYRDPSGIIVHSGVVQLVRPDHVLVESKWGKAGRFLHAPETQPYSSKYEYYRALKPDTEGRPHRRQPRFVRSGTQHEEAPLGVE